MAMISVKHQLGDFRNRIYNRATREFDQYICLGPDRHNIWLYSQFLLGIPYAPFVQERQPGDHEL